MYHKKGLLILFLFVVAKITTLLSFLFRQIFIYFHRIINLQLFFTWSQENSCIYCVISCFFRKVFPFYVPCNSFYVWICILDGVFRWWNRRWQVGIAGAIWGRFGRSIQILDTSNLMPNMKILKKNPLELDVICPF